MLYFFCSIKKGKAAKKRTRINRTMIAFSQEVFVSPNNRHSSTDKERSFLRQGQIMSEFICLSDVLSQLLPLLPTVIARGWFAVTIVGFITRPDHYGVTSFIRALDLPGRCYLRLLSFFRKCKIDRDLLERKWWVIAVAINQPYMVHEKVVLITDGTKVQKEGKHMPAVKKLGQTSVDQTKPSYIWGTMFQSVSLLCGKVGSMFACPLTMPIVDGIAATADWIDSPYQNESQVVRAAKDACKIALEIMKPCILLGDRYYLSRFFLKVIQEHNEKNPTCTVEILSKAKKSYTAYYPLTEEQRKDKRRKKGASVKVFSFFEDPDTKFEDIQAYLYGKQVTARVARKELLWGVGVYVPLSFIFVKYFDEDMQEERREVLACMDTTLTSREIMELYSYRFKVEVQFKADKSTLGILSYRFWTGHQPKLDKKRKKGDPDPLEGVTDPHDRRLILEALHATELFVFCGIVAQGILQHIALRFATEGDRSKLRFQRTPANAAPSEENIMYIMRKGLADFLENQPENEVARLIRFTKERALWDDLRAEREQAS